MNTLTERLTAAFPTLKPWMESGDGFRVNEWQPRLVSSGTGCLEFDIPDHRVTVRQQITVADASCVVAVELANKTDLASSPIHVLEPLRLTFRLSLERWQLRYGRGATLDSYYPPASFTVTERARIREPFKAEPFRIESHPGGRSSELHLPVLFALFDQREDSDGLFCALEWSGEWYIQVSSASDGRSELAVGLKVNGLVMDSRERLQLPPVHIGLFRGGFVSGVNSLRRYLADRLCPRAENLPPVSYNHWFGIGNRLSFDLLRRQADRAASLGVEYFVVDSSWFVGGFPRGVGNWHSVDRSKFPDGLLPLSRHVSGLGMKFGLWFEPERAMAGTDALKAHPELFVAVHEGEHAGHWTRDYFLLNLALPEATDYIRKMVSGYVRELDIRWIRWDYNSHFPIKLWEVIDRSGKLQILYYQALYRLWDDLMADFHGCLIEQCAGGGRRIDFATIRRAHTIWISDETVDPLCCRYMQANANCFLPGHLLNSCVPVPLGSADGSIDDTALLSRMMGALQISGDIAGWSEKLTRRVTAWVREYKKVRHLLSRDYHRLLPNPASVRDWHAELFTSREGREALLFAFRGQGAPAVRHLPLPEALARNGEWTSRRLPAGRWAPVQRKPDSEVEIVAELQPLKGAAWHLRVR